MTTHSTSSYMPNSDGVTTPHPNNVTVELPAARKLHSYLYINYVILIYIMLLYICDWLWENPPVTHKNKYLEIRNSIIQSVISREGLKLHAYNSLQIYSYL